MLVKNPYLVEAGKQAVLKDWDPSDTDGMDKAEAREEMVDLVTRLGELQQLLYASRKHALLVVLQGMDTSGKDGTIAHVMGGFNPQGCAVTAFKVPTEEELSHDFLWRVHQAVPARGMVGIFNRSHYEDVLVVRVEELVPRRTWKRRYRAINSFEELLSEGGTIVAKFYLHISKEEQRLRLEERRQEPHDHWKFRMGDLATRAKWDDYVAAYEEALSRCSTQRAPWYIIPADRKWYRNLLISRILVETLESLNMAWPPLEPGAESVVIV